MTDSPNNNNRNNGDSGENHDPLEDFLKKMQESGFDPTRAESTGGAPGPEDFKNMGIPFDPAMVQGILEQMGTMFSLNANQNTEQGVNWTGVKDQAQRMIASAEDPVVPENLKKATVDAANLADLWLDSVTSFERHNTPIEAWSKSEWLDASFDSWREIVAPVAAEVTQAMVLPASDDIPQELASLLGNGGFLNNLGSTFFGIQMAQALAALAGEVYSSTDIGFPLAPGRTALLPNGFKTLGDEIEVPSQEVLLYLAVREATLIRLHHANPWLREDIMALVSRYARGIRVDMNRIQEAASEVNLHDPEAVQEAFEGGMFNPQRTEDQQLAVERLEALLALIEGWVSFVVEQATHNLPKAPQIAEIFTRRRVEGGPTEQVFETLVNLQIRPRLVREALAFWRDYDEKHGFEARDNLWLAPETLPTAKELENFTEYENRVSELSINDVDFDSELQKLLDGEFDEGNNNQ